LPAPRPTPPSRAGGSPRKEGRKKRGRAVGLLVFRATRQPEPTANGVFGGAHRRKGGGGQVGPDGSQGGGQPYRLGEGRAPGTAGILPPPWDFFFFVFPLGTAGPLGPALTMNPLANRGSQCFRPILPTAVPGSSTALCAGNRPRPSISAFLSTATPNAARQPLHPTPTPKPASARPVATTRACHPPPGARPKPNAR